MNIQSHKKPPTAVQQHTQQHVRGQQNFQGGPRPGAPYRQQEEYNLQHQQHLPFQPRNPNQAGNYLPQDQSVYIPQQQLHILQEQQQAIRYLNQGGSTPQPPNNQPPVTSAHQNSFPRNGANDMNLVSSVANRQPPQAPTPPNSNPNMFQPQPPRTMLGPRPTVPPQQQQPQRQQPQQQQQPPQHMSNLTSSPGPIYHHQPTTMFIPGQPPLIQPGTQMITISGGNQIIGYSPGNLPGHRIPGQFMPNSGPPTAQPTGPFPMYQSPPQAYQQQVPPNIQQQMPPPPQHPKETTGVRQPTGAIYFNPPTTQPGSINPSMRPQAQVQQANQNTYQRRQRSSRLAIVDPTTGKDVSEKIYNTSEPSATPSSSVSSLPEADASSAPVNTDIQAKFAEQVIAAISKASDDQSEGGTGASAVSTKTSTTVIAASVETTPSQQPAQVSQPVSEEKTVVEEAQVVNAAPMPSSSPVAVEVVEKEEIVEEAKTVAQTSPEIAPQQQPPAPNEAQEETSHGRKKKHKGQKSSDMHVTEAPTKPSSQVEAAPVAVPVAPAASVPPSEPAPPAPVPTPVEVLAQTPVEDKEEAPVAEETSISTTLEKAEIITEIASESVEEPQEEPEIAQNGNAELDEDEDDSDSKVALKYEYKEDQWSPLNPEGKKHYDRKFLLELQFSKESTTKPIGLAHLPDIILDTPLNQTEKRGGHGADSKRDLFAPGYIQSISKPPPRSGNTSKRGSQQRTRGGGNYGGGTNAPKVINLPMTEVKLHQTDNAWTPDHKAKKADQSEDEAKTEALYKAVTSILNKLTPQKFDTLSSKILQLPIDSEERLKGCIDLIFEKAIDEPNFSVAYANMARRMTTIKVQSNANPAEHVLFRNLLLNRCQREFEKEKSNDEEDAAKEKEIAAIESDVERKRMKEEMDLQRQKNRRRTLGNIRFIGELFRLKMLTEKIMHDCLVRLLKAADEEENLECFCRLMTTIGKNLDENKNSSRRVDTYFHQLDRLITTKVTSSRVRFMMKDLIDLRANAWKPRREENNPKTIQQIHEEAAKQEEEKQKSLQAMASMPPPMAAAGYGRGRHRPQAGNTGPVGEDGWHAVGSSKSNRIDPEKMKLTHQFGDESTIKLGPQGGRKNQPSWTSGSSGGGGRRDNAAGSRNASKEMEKSEPGNRFSALSGADSSSSYERGNNRNSRGGSGRADSRDKRMQGVGRGVPAGIGRGSRPSAEERESALAAVRNLTAPGSRNQSRESSRDGRGAHRSDSRDSRQSQGAAASAAPQPVPQAKEEVPAQTKDRAKIKATSLLEEYLNNTDINEAIACAKEIHPIHRQFFVSELIENTLEKTEVARQKTGDLLHATVQHGVVSEKEYLDGLADVLQFAEDMEIDIPCIWKYLGQLIGPLVQDDTVTIEKIEKAALPISKEKRAVFLAEVLHRASDRAGHIVIGDKWRKSGLQWSDYVAQKSLADFIKNRKLEFTTGTPEPKSPGGKNLSPEKIQQELDSLMDKDTDSSDIIDWVQRSVGEAHMKDPVIIRALVKSVCRSAIKGDMTLNVGKLTKRTLLLQRFLDHQENLELQALYALQSLVNELQHPASLLRSYFDTMYDEDVISEDAFNAWEASDDPAEMAGKGVAINSVTQFYTWLRNADDAAES